MKNSAPTPTDATGNRSSLARIGAAEAVPTNGLGVGIVLSSVAVDCGLEIDNRVEAVAADALGQRLMESTATDLATHVVLGRE